MLVELEAVRLAVTGTASLWRALLSGAPQQPDLDPSRLEELLRRARRQLRTLDSLHARAASERLSPAPPRPREPADPVMCRGWAPAAPD